MNKEEVELIIFKFSADGQDAINMKIYKNGTICRYGVGGLPQIGIAGMSFIHNSKYFDPLIAKVPQEILDQPLNYEEKTPNGYLEYVIAFYGLSTNGDTGERAEWSKSAGVRAKIDQKSEFNDPIMRFLDGLTLDAAELTNEWYFDVIMQVVFNAKSSTLPEETIFMSPKTEKEIKNDFQHYMSQMKQIPRKWNIKEFVENKYYEINGEKCEGFVMEDNNSFTVHFYSKNGHEIKNKPKWKFWQ